MEGNDMSIQLACPRCGSRKIAVAASNPEEYPFKTTNAQWWKCEECEYHCGHSAETGACSASVDLIVGAALVLIAVSAVCWLALY
jgi:transposase-like protein